MLERPLSYRIDRPAGRLVVHGMIDEMTVSELRAVIEKASDSLASDLTIDLSDVDLLPSVGVAVLATTRRDAKANGAAIVFQATEGSVPARVLTLCQIPFVTV